MEKQHEMEIVEQAFTLLDKEELTDAIVDEVFGLLGKVFDEDCLKQIQWGFENGLTPEQVGVYAKSEFTREQMEKIRFGLKYGLTMEQVEMYAKPEFTREQMEQIRVGFENRLSLEQVSVYAKPKFTCGQMEAIRLGFENRLSMEQVSVYAKREFIEQQMHEIRVGFENGLSMEQVAVFVKPEFGWYQMQTIRRGFEADLSMEQVSVYAKPEFTGEQMRQIRLGFEKGLSMEQVEVFARQEFTDSQMEEIRLGFEHGLTPEQVSMYAKPELTAEQMEELREGFEQKLRKSSLVEKIMTAKKEQGQAVSKEPEKSRERAGVMRNWRNKNRIKGEIMNVLFFTGAGISKDSGVPTFQEIDGIRTKLRRKYAALHPAEIRDMMREFKGFMKDKEPNAAHVAIAKTGFPVITMNVDELHQRAGSKDVLAIHGDIPSEEELGKWYYPYLPLGKPVLYGDIAPRYYKAFAKLRSLREGDYLVIVGTSFYTNISKDIRKMAEKRGAKVISINENATVEVPRVCEELLRKVEEGGKSYGTRNVYKIHHSFACDDTGSIYIATNLSVEEVADLIIGLEFYIETHSKYGERSCITEEMAGYFLCEFYGAILVSRERLSKLNEYDKEEEDITSEYWIDLYGDREKRCGPDFHKYIDKIEEYTETEYVKKLCAFFSDDTIFCSHIIREFSVKKIMENYEV